MSDFENGKFDISSDEFSLEAILAEYRAEALLDGESAEHDERAENSRRIVMEAAGEVAAAELESEPIFSAPKKTEEAPEPVFEPESEPETVPEPEPEHEPESEPEYEPEPIETESALYEEPEEEYASADYPPQEQEFDDEPDGDEGEHFSAARAGEILKGGAKTFQERILLPIVAYVAALASRKKQREENAAKYPDPVSEAEEIPEMTAAKASRFYSVQARALRYRGRFALILCAILCYITFAYSSKLPLLGSLGSDIRATALMCLIIELAVMLTGLDVLANGFTGALRGEIGIETLAFLSAIISVVDTIIIAVSGNDTVGLPYCAASALSILFALWGARLHCTALRVSFGTAAQAKNPYVAASVEDVDDDCNALMKFRVPFSGFIRRAEESDICEEAYITAAPILIVASVVLAVVASAHGQFGSFFHILSALLAVSASLSGFVSFALPYSVAAKKMSRFGAAVAGYRGCEAISDAARIVVTDSDVFPAGTLSIGSIRIVEGAFTDRVIASTGSVLAASGCSISSAFTEIMRSNGFSMLSVEEFAINDGGGFTAYVQGDRVYVGTSAFMQLMGVRIPRSADSKTALYTAINGSLVGFFTIEYKPITSVQDALVSLLRGRKYPMFATRDLNINPLLLSQKFKIPTEGLDFPSFAERFEISAKEPPEDMTPAAVLTREGLAPLVEASETGTRLCKTAKLCTVISVAGSFAGLLIMFLLCWAKSYDAASAANVITFMLLWFVPVIVTSFGLS
jgi:hypothetical protein